MQVLDGSAVSVGYPRAAAETCAEPCRSMVAEQRRSMVANRRQFSIRREIYFQATHIGFGYHGAKVRNVLIR